jgi:hypothetical protein
MSRAIADEHVAMEGGKWQKVNDIHWLIVNSTNMLLQYYMPCRCYISIHIWRGDIYDGDSLIEL